MDTNFTFPARPGPVPRPQPVHTPSEPPNRESNAIRASVLDAALQLGFGANGGLADWMSNNAVNEEEEDDEDTTSKGPLSATSDEYGNYSYSTPPTSTSSHSEIFHPPQPQVHFPAQPVAVISTPFPFPEPPPAPSASSSGNKLRKARRADGYESDGGYVSDGGKKARVRTKSKTAKDAPPPTMAIGEPMELVALTKEEKKRRKKELGKLSPSKDNGAETDAEDAVKAKSKPPKPKKKEKKPSTDAGGYETDDGYVSSSGKKATKTGRGRFFSLRRKPSSDTASEAPPPVPELVPDLPPMPEFDLPIASRFATTFEGGSGAPSRSETPLLPPSRPFASPGMGNSGSSTSSLSSSSNSLLTPGDQDSLASARGGVRFADDVGDQLNSRANSGSNSPPSTASGGKSKFFGFSRSGSSNSLDGSPKQAKHVPSPIATLSPSAPNSALDARSPSPIAGSPFVVLTPINTNINSGYAPPRAVSPSPSAATNNIVPSSDFIIPSRSGSPLPPSPNVLAYYNYDPVPPSPPPTMPLPRAPPSSSGRAREANTEPVLGLARLRGMSQDRGGRSPVAGRSVSPSPTATSGAPGMSLRPMSPGGGGGLRPVSPGGGLRPVSPGGLRPVSPGGLMSPVSAGGVQRGRAAPFPTQPVSGSRPAPGSLGPGLAARAKVQRYRDLYAIQIPATPDDARRARFADEVDDEVDIRVEDWDEDDRGGREEYEYEAEEDGDGEEMREVLGRFRDPHTQREEKGRRMAIALERNNSGALRPGIGRPIRPSSPSPSRPAEFDDARYPQGAYSDDDEASRYPDEDRTAGRSTMYRVEGGRETMRWSGYTVDTRASFLDVDKSEQARGALVNRVGEMFDLSGRERSAAPPVPKLPAGLVAGGPGGNRF
ncbi:hypothetical protein B0H14DRAFT_1045960 [Mycena olivaceomarginata]|nr:hypothetical protein B0H14DRAFT_1045960 [Mycena olivaceomarginata]